mgnify:CR=1 FL=1|jgi:hypothetical protein
MTHVFVYTLDGQTVEVEMPDNFFREETGLELDKNLNHLKAIFPGNIDYICIKQEDGTELKAYFAY